MQKPGSDAQVEPKILAAWLTARSIARGLPLPVPDQGGLRVDTGMPDEYRRYVFAATVPAIRELALAIDTPRTVIKLCGSTEQLQALLPPGWQLQPGAYFMTHGGGPSAAMPPLPAGYRIALAIDNTVTVARIIAADGAVAASGYAVAYDGVFIFDRILTAAAHRRRGLGKVLMAALASTQASGAAQRVLVATGQGRALYTTLGWTVLSPYSTAMTKAA